MVRVVLLVALVACYMMVWQPARNGSVVAVYEYALSDLASESPSGTVRLEGSGRAIRVGTGTKGTSTVLPLTLRAPAGVVFLLPAIALVIVAPFRAYWLFLWVCHVSIFLACVGLIAMSGDGLRGAMSGGAAPLGLYVVDFLQAYAIDVVSIAIPTIAIIRK
jgi:hypothetical protein